MYFNGEVVAPDYLRAYMWMNLAVYNGGEESTVKQKIIAEGMTTADISKAQDMSSRCLESNYTDC
jgi:TPR repeat protein